MQGCLSLQCSLLYWTYTANLERQLLCWMFPMVTARLIVRAQAEMADRCFLQDKEASRPPAMEKLFFSFFKRHWRITQENWRTHIHARTDNSAQLVWRQPLRVSFLFEEPNFYQYRFGLLWENSSWPCSHSSLWASQGLVNRLHKFPCLYSLQPPSRNKQPISFIRNATENPNLSCIHIQPTLLSKVQTPQLDSTFERLFWNCFYQTVHNAKKR